MKAQTAKAVLNLERLDLKKPIESPLHCRMMYLKSSGQGFLFCQYELTSLREYAIDEIRNYIYEKTGIPKEQIWIGVSHTFNAPHVRSQQTIDKDPDIRKENEKLMQVLLEGAGNCLEQIRISGDSGDIDVDILAGSAFSFLNVNRDQDTPQGMWLGCNPDGYSDPAMPLLVIKDPDTGNILCILAALDMQPSSLQDIDWISSDIYGKACLDLEEEYPGSVVILMPGACGDQRPGWMAKDEISDSDINNSETGRHLQEHKNRQAAELAACIKQAIETGELQKISNPDLKFTTLQIPLPAKKLPDMKSLYPRKTICYEQTGQRLLNLYLLDLSEAMVLGCPPELNSSTGHAIRNIVDKNSVLLGCLINNAEKYLPDAKSYEAISYEAQNSPYGPEAEKNLLESLEEYFHNQKPDV